MQRRACMPTLMRMLTYFRRLLVVDNGRTFISCPLYDWYAMHTRTVGIDQVMIYTPMHLMLSSSCCLVTAFGLSTAYKIYCTASDYSWSTSGSFVFWRTFKVSNRRQRKIAMRVEPRSTRRDAFYQLVFTNLATDIYSVPFHIVVSISDWISPSVFKTVCGWESILRNK